MYLLGFIGVGNMGGALARAACVKTDPARIVLANRTAQKRKPTPCTRPLIFKHRSVNFL